ncbi:MAG: ROK family protein [Ferruginibacter sp.]
MVYTFFKRLSLLLCTLISANQLFAQPKYNLKFKHSDVYAGIEVGSKGVKMSILEIGKNPQKENIFNILKDTSSNTDFISFTDPTYSATLTSLYNLYNTAVTEYKIAPSKIYTVVSSGVKVQAEKSDKTAWITKLTNDFKAKVKDPSREVAVIDVTDEARLSHLGIVPDERRYSTFLIDIGSGNTKGGFFPNGDTKTLRLFELSWGTKSVANATDKRSGDDKSLATFDKNLYRVLSGDAKNEIVYAVNVSNAYNMSDYIAFSGGIAWSAATLMFPELIENPVVPVTYDEMVKFNDRILNNYSSLSDLVITNTLSDKSADKALIGSEVKRVNKVFDQKSLLAGTGLLLNIMRQFEGVYEKKQFYLVKNGQVGWISAYVNQHLSQ